MDEFRDSESIADQLVDRATELSTRIMLPASLDVRMGQAEEFRQLLGESRRAVERVSAIRTSPIIENYLNEDEEGRRRSNEHLVHWIGAIAAFENIVADLAREPLREFLGQQMDANAQIQEWIQREAATRAEGIMRDLGYTATDDGRDVTVVVNLLQRDQPEGPRPNVPGFNFQGQGFRIGEDPVPTTGASASTQEPVPMEVDETPAPPVIPVGREPREPEVFDIGTPAGSELSQSTVEYTDTAEAETQAAPVSTTGGPTSFWDAEPSEEAAARARELREVEERVARETTITIDDESQPPPVPTMPYFAPQPPQVPSASTKHGLGQHGVGTGEEGDVCSDFRQHH